jgi:hypothetical protein
MPRQFVVATLVAAFLTVATSPMASAEDKQATPQQQKMKDCAANWKEEKTKTGAAGGEAYHKFMSGCLKKQT